MTAETFDRSLRAFARRAPFSAFTVEFVRGGRITVDHPEALVCRGGLAAYIAPDGTPTLFDHESVSRLEGTAGSTKEQAA